MSMTSPDSSPLSYGDPPAIIPDHAVWPLSVERYHRMVRAGILTEDDPVELLEGRLAPKMPKNPPHSVSTGKICEALNAIVRPDWCVRCQDPITTDDSEPEPDANVARGNLDDYVERHPEPSELGLVVEVADTSLSDDRGVKKRVYARAGIMTYWIINLRDRQIEVCTQPSGPKAGAEPDYSQRQDFRPGEEVPVVLDGKEVARLAVDDLLPKNRAN